MTEREWYAEPWFIASGVFLAVLVIAGSAFLLVGDGGGSTARTVAQKTRHVDTGGSVCGLPVGNTDPVVGPPDARWTLVGKIAAPYKAGIGPGVIDGHDRRCFAHSPVGALLAAANFLPTTTAASAADARMLLAHFLPGRVVDVYAKQPSPPVDPAARVQIAGFRVTVVSRDAVDVTLALQTNVQGGVMVSCLYPMRWFRGDWRVRLGSLQEPFVVEAPVTLDGFVRWAGA